MANKYIYGEQFAQKLPGSNQNFYFRTITGYEVDNNGNPIEGTARTDLYYAPKPAARTSDGKTWTPGTADSIDNFNPGGWVRAGSTADNGKTYTFRNYSQEDADLGKIPPGKKVGDEVLGATAQQSLTTSGGRFYEAVQNNLINLAVNTQPGLAQVVSAKQKNTVAQQQASPEPIPNAPVPINNPEIKTEGVRKTPYDNYYYPETLRGNKEKQDIIRFTAFSYTGRNLTIKDSSQTSFGTPGLAARNLKDIKGSVTLPIQPQITDNNSVQWGSENLNPLQAFGAAVSYGAQDDIAGAAQQTMDAVEKLAKTSGGNMSQAFRVYLAGKAVGVEGLLSRIGGAVLNPNMELLFQGPQLRPFNFTFRLSPRNAKEAEQVKYIIRFFKENMSVQNTADNIFLKAPNVFQIRYLIRGEGDHPSLNRIKICALQSCSVDYTPDGSYMTFSDQDATMTSYSISLQFQELEPVTAKDYTSNTNIKEIGY